MIKKVILFFMVFQSLSGWTQDLKKTIQGKWEMLQYDLSEDKDEDEEIATGQIWIFKEGNICEERIDPNDSSKKVIYDYKISQENCLTKDTNEKYYLRLTNMTIPGDDYCFLISKINANNESDKSERLSLFSHGAISPNVLIRK
jgi:hypothetical protein